MTYALQCCTRCGELERGHTGPADRYLCAGCRAAGWRQDSLGQVYQIESYRVHVWSSERHDWDPGQPPTVEATTPRAAYLAAKEQHPGAIVHVARVLTEPCTPGE